VHIDVANKDQVVVTASNQRAYMWKNNKWNALPGAGIRTTIGSKNAFIVAKDGSLYKGTFAEYFPTKQRRDVQEDDEHAHMHRIDGDDVDMDDLNDDNFMEE